MVTKYTSDQVESAGKQVTERVAVYAPDGEFLAVAYRQVAVELECARNELLEALKAAEFAEAKLIEWARFWDIAPEEVLVAIEDAQTKRNAAISNAEAL